ncbi:unnamed protein product [Ilex paraguariensis]|uniref:Uncharacterized protein n=1 Tax=Ilex paraguariensis TaxID=185542 RepID=A0ABC8SYI0_9AQUA
MGTKLQFAINPLALSPSNNFSGSYLEDWDYLQNTEQKGNLRTAGFDKAYSSMERMPECQSIESIKKTILLHEEIFKHQVRELHRLYTVQMRQMNELKNEMKQNRIWGGVTGPSTKPSHFANQRQPLESIGYDPHVHVQSSRDDLRSRERSSGCSGDTSIMIKGFDLERPAEDMSTGVRASEDDHAGAGSGCQRIGINSKTSMDGVEEESEVELTLSIGCTGRMRSKVHQQHCSIRLGGSEPNHYEFKDFGFSASIKTDSDERVDPNSTMSSSIATFNQESKQPHWLFHGQNLNRT